jgi:hypothetical protein
LDRQSFDGSISTAFRETTAWFLGDDDDLPLFSPPKISLAATRQGSDVGERVISVTLQSTCDPLSIRWEGDGAVEGRGREITWRPTSDAAQLRVAVRSEGGIAVTAIRAVDVAVV